MHGFPSEIRKSGRDGGGALSDGFESGKRENRKRRQRALEPLGQEADDPVKSRGLNRRGGRRRRHEASVAPSARPRSMRSRMNFARIDSRAAPARNSGSVLRSNFGVCPQNFPARNSGSVLRSNFGVCPQNFPQNFLSPKFPFARQGRFGPRRPRRWRMKRRSGILFATAEDRRVHSIVSVRRTPGRLR